MHIHTEMAAYNQKVILYTNIQWESDSVHFLTVHPNVILMIKMNSDSVSYLESSGQIGNLGKT